MSQTVHIRKITVRNKLSTDITDVRVIYGAGNKLQGHSALATEYWFDWKTVDLVTRQNVVFISEQNVGHVASGSETSADGFKCSGYYRGYWQVMWKDSRDGKYYRINKNNAQVNVWDIDEDCEVEIAILKEGDNVRVDFKLPSGNAYFYAESL